MSEIDDVIGRYRADLAAAADLAREDLDEVEDHLRALTDELRAAGLGDIAAVHEAARRLGDPKALAREHVRVRSAFGARLSRGRAWAAALLMLPGLALALCTNLDLWSREALETGFGLALLLALVAGVAWARPVLLGGVAFFFLPTALWIATTPDASPVWLGWHLSIVALLAPWRRREMTGAAAALGLQVWAYGAAALALGYQITTPQGEIAPLSAAIIALAAAIAGATGVVLRARWAALASLISSIALAATFVQLSRLQFRFTEPEVYRSFLLVAIGSGAVASGASAVLGWRSARSALGSLREVLS